MTAHDYTLSDLEDDDEHPNTSVAGRRESITREIRMLLHAYGDKKEPYDKTVESLEQIVIGYVTLISTSAMRVGKVGKINLQDIFYLIGRDKKKCARVTQLLTLSDELKKARKAFDEPTEFVKL